MKVIPSDKSIELAQNYLNRSLDIGTGDGKMLYRKASKNPEYYFMGVEPAETQLKETVRKLNREKIDNICFIISSFENLELNVQFNEITINLPWGTLLRDSVNANEIFMNKLSHISSEGTSLTILLGYQDELEPTETKRLNLELELTERYILDKMIPAYKNFGWNILDYKKILPEELKSFDTTWSKKLSHRKERDIFHLKFVRV